MTDFHHDEDEERGTLRDRLPHLSVPASLHARVRDSLRSRELIRDSRLRGTWRRPATLAAAAVLCFAAGLFAGRQAPTQRSEERRVGKEWRCRGWQGRSKKKKREQQGEGV